MSKGETLVRANWLLSPNEQFALIMQHDGNLGLYTVRSNWQRIWSSRTSGQENRLVLQNDGNMVIYDSNNRAIWHTGTINGHRLNVENGGSIVLYDFDDNPVWSSNWTSPRSSNITTTSIDLF